MLEEQPTKSSALTVAKRGRLIHKYVKLPVHNLTLQHLPVLIFHLPSVTESFSQAILILDTRGVSREY